MYRKIMTLISLFCLCFSCRAYAENLFIGDNPKRTDYKAYMDAVIPENGTGTAMLLFRAKNIELLGYGVSYYEVGFEDSSKLIFRKYYTGYFKTHTVTLKTVNVDSSETQKNITVDAVGNTFKIHLNGEMVIEYTDNGTYDKDVKIIPANTTGDIGYRVDGDFQIIDYGSTDYNVTEKTHISSVEITDSEGNIIKNGSNITPGEELNYNINFTESYNGVSIVAANNGDGRLLEADMTEAPGDVKTGTFIAPENRSYFNLTEFAWKSMGCMTPEQAKSKIAEFNLKRIIDFYGRQAISEKEKYTINKEHFMSGSSTEGVNIYFSRDGGLQDVAGIVLASANESELHGVNCYRAVIRNKNTVSLEKVYDGVTTTLVEYVFYTPPEEDFTDTDAEEDLTETIPEREEHELKLHIYGSRISVYFDGRKVIKYHVPDIFYLSGYPGTYQYGNSIELSKVVFSN